MSRTDVRYTVYVFSQDLDMKCVYSVYVDNKVCVICVVQVVISVQFQRYQCHQ